MSGDEAKPVDSFESKASESLLPEQDTDSRGSIRSIEAEVAALFRRAEPSLFNQALSRAVLEYRLEKQCL